MRLAEKDRAAIIGNGKEFVPEDIDEYGLIIGCDGGCQALHQKNVMPNLLVGDFDSIQPDILNYYQQAGLEMVAFPKEKNYTDMQLAIDEAFQRGYSLIDLYGASGSRLDHTLMNMMLLFYIQDQGGYGRMIDENNLIFAAERETILEKFFDRQYVSLIPVEDCRGISLTGFKYPLKEFNSLTKESRCISNELVEKKGIVRIRSGRMLIIVAKEE